MKIVGRTLAVRNQPAARRGHRCSFVLEPLEPHRLFTAAIVETGILGGHSHIAQYAIDHPVQAHDHCLGDHISSGGRTMSDTAAHAYAGAVAAVAAGQPDARHRPHKKAHAKSGSRHHHRKKPTVPPSPPAAPPPVTSPPGSTGSGSSGTPATSDTVDIDGNFIDGPFAGSLDETFTLGPISLSALPQAIANYLTEEYDSDAEEYERELGLGEEIDTGPRNVSVYNVTNNGVYVTGSFICAGGSGLTAYDYTGGFVAGPTT